VLARSEECGCRFELRKESQGNEEKRTVVEAVGPIVNLQFSCSFFLQGEGTPNGRLRERAGRLDVLDEAWEALDSAMRGDCGRRWRLLGDCCPESGS
jgi:hypothetical protein